MVSGGTAVSAEVWIYVAAQAALGPGWWAWRRWRPRARVPQWCTFSGVHRNH
jgi:hypothetical protein